MNKRTISLSGHIIDSLTLTKTMAIIMDKGGEFDILEINVGRKKSDISNQTNLKLVIRYTEEFIKEF